MSILALATQAQDSASDDGSDEEVFELEAFEVTGYRASLMRSTQIKRESTSIVDVISSEDIGKFPDVNVAESLSHLTGISVDRQFGEGEKVSILGTDPALNRVLVNGQTIASGDWGGNPTDTSGRTFNYTLLSPEIVGVMEVYKSSEARLDEGSIGGTVIVNTNKPLDLGEEAFRGSFGYSYNDRSEQGNLRASALYNWVNEEEDFGFLVSVTRDQEDLYRAGIEYWGAAGTTQDGEDYTVAFGMNSSWFKQERERNGIQGVVEWKPMDNLDLTFTGIHIEGTYDNFSQSRYVVPAFWGTLDSYTANSDNYITGGHVTAAEGEAPAVADGQFDTNLRLSTVTTDSLHLNGELEIDDNWTASFDVGYTKAAGGKDPEYLFSTVFNESFTFAYSGESSSLYFDDATAATDPTTYTTRAVGSQAGGIEYTTTDDNEKYAQVDFERRVEWGPFYKLLFGAKYTDHVNSQESYGNRIDVTEVLDLSDFDYTYAPSALWDGIDTSGDTALMVTPTAESVVAYLLSLPQGEFEEKYSNEWYVNEKNTAAYVQGDIIAGDWTGNIGLRYVDTTDDSTYWQYNSTEGTYTLVNQEKNYSKVLPSFNLNYNFSPDLKLRFGAAEVMARPRYSELAGYFALDDERLTGGGGNPDLDPYEAKNLNIALEYYFKDNGGIASVEYFRRDIDNYILSVTEDVELLNFSTGEMATYSVSSPFNAGNALVDGVAFSFQKDLVGGFGIQANYTYAESETVDGYNLPYLSKDTYNIIPYWEKGPWSVRTSYSWRSSFFTSIGRMNYPLFADDYAQLDASIGYEINDKWKAQLNMSNLLDDTYYWYYQTEYAPMGVYKNGRKFVLSFSYSL